MMVEKIVLLILLISFSVYGLSSQYWYREAGKLKDNSRKIEYYTKSISIDPEFDYAYAGRGLVYYDEKNYVKALEDLNKAVNINPELAIYYYNRGIIFSAQENYEAAKSDFETYLEKKTSEDDPDNTSRVNAWLEQLKGVVQEEQQLNETTFTEEEVSAFTQNSITTAPEVQKEKKHETQSTFFRDGGVEEFSTDFSDTGMLEQEPTVEEVPLAIPLQNAGDNNPIIVGNSENFVTNDYGSFEEAKVPAIENTNFSVPYKAPIISAKPQTVITQREIVNLDLERSYGSKRIFLPDTTIRMEVNYTLEKYPKIMETLIEFITVMEKFNNLSEVDRNSDIMDNSGFADDLQDLGYFPEITENKKSNLENFKIVYEPSAKKEIKAFMVRDGNSLKIAQKNFPEVFYDIFIYTPEDFFINKSKVKFIKAKKTQNQEVYNGQILLVYEK